MLRLEPAIIDPNASAAWASMMRVLKRLRFETHPIVDRNVCCIQHDGDEIFLDEHEIEAAAAIALDEVIHIELQQFDHLPDIRLDTVCRNRLASCAAHLPMKWTI